MTRDAAPLAVAMAAGLVMPFVAAQERPPAPESGTYRIRLCAEPCDSSKPAVAEAMLVIFDPVAGPDEAARPVLAAVRPLRYWGGRVEVAFTPHDACFKVTARQRNVGSEELHFGITASARTSWTYAAETGFRLMVFSSLDAAYWLQWTAPGRLTRGEGWQNGPGPGPGHDNHRNAYFEATYIGPPDARQCQ